MSRPRGHRYGGVHKQIRANFVRRMERGEVFACWRCGEPIKGSWDLGHVDDGSGRGVDGRWPEHPHCNRRTVTHLRERLAEVRGETPPTGNGKPGKAGTLDPVLYPAGVPNWSRHWSGSFNMACPACRELGYGCPDADPDAA